MPILLSVLVFLVGGGSIPKFDYAPALRELAMQGQSSEPGAVNGWPALISVATEAKALIQGIERRERDIDEAKLERGESIEAWEGGVLGYRNCKLASTPRDVCIEQEALDTLESIGFRARVRELQNADVFVADMARHVQSDGMGDLTAIRPVWHAIACLMRRACAAGDFGAASEYLGDLALMSDAVRLQPGSTSHMLALSYQAMLASEVMRIAARGECADEQFLSETLEIVRRNNPRGDNRVWVGIRAEAMSSLHRTVDEKSMSVEGRVELVVPLFGFDYLRAVQQLDAAHRKWLRMRERSYADILEELGAFFAPLEDGSRATHSDWAIVYGAAVCIEREMTIVATAHRLGLAVVLQTLRHGAPPATLEAIARDIIELTPMDELAPDGKFRYVPGATLRDIRLYSVGLDGEDNGGVGDPSGPHGALRRSGAGFDFVIWPPECGSAQRAE